jgi:hypothetical protein
MRAQEFLLEYNLKVSRDSDGVAVKATAGGKQLGHAEFFFDEQGRLDPQTVWVDERFHGQGIAADMYDHLKGLGYTIVRSWDQTDAGRGFWNKHRGPEANIWEVNYPDELTVSDQIQQYFFKRGYELAGEGRDQMAFESPRGTILKVLGIGEDEREQIVKNYVRFFEQNQRNPFYPRIYNSGNFTVDGETYFVYEMERVNYVANEEATLDYIEGLMRAVDREQGEQFLQQNPVPAEMSEAEIFGLIQATEDMIQVLGGQAPLDLTAVENLGRRNNGHLVIVDPYSL